MVADRAKELYEVLYHRGARLAAFKKQLRGRQGEDKILSENRKAILRFLDFLGAQGMSNVRMLKYGYGLQAIGNKARMPFEKMRRADVEKLVLDLQRSGYGAYTLKDLKIALKVLFRWFRGTDEYPEEVRWLKANIKEKRLSADELPTEEELQAMVKAASSVQARALIAVLADSGARIGEILTLALDKVHDRETFFLLDVTGKTGRREIPVFECVPALREWLSQHPTRTNGSASLFVIKKKGQLRPMPYSTAFRLLHEATKAAKIKKHIHPHLLRHANSTKLSKDLPEALLNKRQGWVQGSKMPATYLHVQDKAVESAMLNLYAAKAGQHADLNQLAMDLAELLLENPKAMQSALAVTLKDPERAPRFKALWEKAEKLRKSANAKV